MALSASAQGTNNNTPSATAPGDLTTLTGTGYGLLGQDYAGAEFGYTHHVDGPPSVTEAPRRASSIAIDNSHHRIHLHGGPFLYFYFLEYSTCRRGNLGINLVGRDLEQRFVARHLLTPT